MSGKRNRITLRLREIREQYLLPQMHIGAIMKAIMVLESTAALLQDGRKLTKREAEIAKLLEQVGLLSPSDNISE